MNEKRFKKMDTIIDPFPIWDTVEEKGYNCTDTLDVLIDLLNGLSEENELLRTQLLICQQSKSEDGRFQVWEVPPIPKGTRITFSTTTRRSGKDE